MNCRGSWRAGCGSSRFQTAAWRLKPRQRLRSLPAQAGFAKSAPARGFNRQAMSQYPQIERQS